MQVEVWCRQSYIEECPAFELWTGELPAVPRVGEFIVPWEGWGAMPVEAVIYSPPSPIVTIELNGSAEVYREHLRRKAAAKKGATDE